MLAEWLLIGTWPFWLVTLGIIAAIIAAVENEKGLWATVCFVGYLVALHLAGGVDVLMWARSHIEWIASGAIAYLVIGAAWGVAKWYFFTRKRALEVEENYRTARKDFLRNGIVHPEDVELLGNSGNYNDRRNFFERIGDYFLARTGSPTTTESGKQIRRISLPDATEDTPVPPEMRAAWQAIVNSGYYVLNRQNISIKPPRPNDHKSTILTWMTFWPASLAWTMLNDPVRAAFRHIYTWLSRTLQDISNRAFAEVANMSAADTRLDPPTPPTAGDGAEKGPLPPGTSDVPAVDTLK